MDVLSFFVIFSISFFSFFVFMIIKRISDSYKLHMKNKMVEVLETEVYDDHNE